LHQNFRNVNVKSVNLTPRNLEGVVEETVSGILYLEAKAEKPLHVGSGKTTFKVSHKTINKLKRARGFYDVLRIMGEGVQIDYMEQLRYGSKVVIPGSTLKGLCRARIQLLSTSKENISFTLEPATRLKAPPLKHTFGWRHFRLWSPATLEYRRLKRGGLSIDRDIFGVQGIASRVFFGNLVAEGDCIDRYVLDHGEKLEVVKEGTVFKGELSFIGLRPEELGLVAIGLRLHEDKPVLIGRSKYRRRESEDGREIIIGRLSIKPIEYEFTWYSKPVLRKLNVDFEERDGWIILKETERFTRKIAEMAFNKFPELRKDFDEIERLEEIWGEE